MSYDYNTRLAACDHMQSFERYVVDAGDFRTLHLAANPALNLRAPINGQAQVKVYISGKLVTPNHPVYGYDILADDNRIQTSDRFYKIVFKRPVRFFVPMIEVSYITLGSYCLKCGAKGQVNDLKKATNGGLLRVVGTDKLVQQVLKMVLTSRCPYYPQLTCKIRDYIGKKFGAQITETDIASQITQALLSLKQIQANQRIRQALDPQEMLKDITDITTSMPDPTSVNVLAYISSYGNAASVPVSFSVTTTRQLVGN